MTGSTPDRRPRQDDAPAAPSGDDRAAPILTVRDLRAQFDTPAGPITVLDGVSFDILPGETVGVVGESGSGKSLTALAVLQLLPDNCNVTGGSIRFEAHDMLALSEREIRSIRGADVAMIFQDPMTSLNPVLRISRQIVEMMTEHGTCNVRDAVGRATGLLTEMGVNAPERALRSYPHQFSGGMRQRVTLAIGVANRPALLIADEPTTALDVTIQAQILDLLRGLNADHDTAIMLISHDLGAIASICRRVVVMYAGEVVEQGPAEDLLAAPKHPYTWALVNAVPRLDDPLSSDKRLTVIEGMPPDPARWPGGCRFAARCPFRMERCNEHPPLLPVRDGHLARCWMTQTGAGLPTRRRATGAPLHDPASARSAEPRHILEVRGLVKHFPLGGSIFGRQPKVHAVDGVDFSVAKGETLGLVGESGCGKSTLARLVARIHTPDRGKILFDGQDIAFAEQAALRPLRRRMQMVFQDPYASLNPRMTVGAMLAEPVAFHGLSASPSETARHVAELLELVGLPPAAASRYPHEFSGGQRQRISIARALAVSPDMIIADEPVSALDVNIQAQVLNLLADLQRRLDLTYLFIAHDLAVVRHISDRIAVLYLGKLVEIAPAADLFSQPLHPYTVSLISAVPIPDAAIERSRHRILLSGDPPSAIDPPSGCRFRTRCPIARERCATDAPLLAQHNPGHFAACHYAGQL